MGLAAMVRVDRLETRPVVLGGLIYSVTAYPYMDQTRVLFLNWAAAPWLQLEINIGRVLEKSCCCFTVDSRVFAVLLLCAIAGSVQLARNVVARQDTALRKVLMGLACVLTVPTVIFLVSGAVLFFRDFNEGARTLMGFAVLLVLLFYLSHLALAHIHERLTLLLVVPLLAMLSLSYAYGRVLSVQNTFASSALFSPGMTLHPIGNCARPSAYTCR